MPNNEKIPQKFNLSNADKLALVNMAYGENASEDLATAKMTMQTAINRLRAGKAKEFGATMPEVLKKGYYAVSKNSPLYQQAVSGKFPDVPSQAKYAEMQKQLDVMMGDQDFGKAQFYFRPEEETKMRKNKTFNFKAVKPTGQVGVYNTYGY